MPRKYTRKKKVTKPTTSTYIVTEKFKADIADHVIIAKAGEEVELTPNEADVLQNYIKEKE